MQQNDNLNAVSTQRSTPLAIVLTLLYRLYGIFIFVPLFLFSSILTAVSAMATSGVTSQDDYGECSLSAFCCCL